MLGKADPTVLPDLCDLRARALPLGEGKIRHVAPVRFGEFAVRHGDDAFVQAFGIIGKDASMIGNRISGFFRV